MENNQYHNSANILSFLYGYRKWLIIVTILGAIISAGGSLMLDNYFMGKVVLYPSATNSISESLLKENYGKANVLEFGEEEQAEQLLQILNSAVIRDRVVKEYDLMHHYEIDSTDQFKRTKLFKKYAQNFNFKRNEYMAVEIEVYDTDPQKAADMANTVAFLLDSVKTEIHRSRSMKGYEIVKRKYEDLKEDITKMEGELSEIMQKGVLNVETQSEAYSTEYAKAISAGKRKVANEIKGKMDSISKYGSAYLSLTEGIQNERLQLTTIKAKYEEAKVDAYEKLPNFFQTDVAYMPEKKAKPKRSIIVIVATFSVFVFACLFLIIREEVKILNQVKPE
ncbi:hypothetical protein OAT71_01330 [Flavobacteriales bacterium]|nr:hypothetical protein [Flavobacteriales bacterium]